MLRITLGRNYMRIYEPSSEVLRTIYNIIDSSNIKELPKSLMVYDKPGALYCLVHALTYKEDLTIV